MTGYYGYPESSRRRDSLLRVLSSSSSLPWVCLGDFNDLLAANEKRGRRDHPNWMLQGFKSAIIDGGLTDLEMEGCQFTWERSRGTVDWVEEKLDRVFASADWIRQFSRAKVWSLESSCFDHLPIFIDPNPLGHIHKSRRFRFENLWLREVDCMDVIRDSWVSSAGSLIQRKISACGSALLEWGGHLARDFCNCMSDCKRRMVLLSGRRDQEGMDEFTEAKNRYNALPHSHEVFWNQRSKSFWLKEGDMNSRYFHMTASVRKRKNTFAKLRNNQGQWCSILDEIDSMIVDYFRNLFTSSGCQSEEVLSFVEMKVTSEQKSMLMAPFSAIEVKEALFGMHHDKSPGQMA